MNRSGWLKRPDCSIYYEVSGSGPALVFAHGLGGNQLSWWQQLAHFVPRYTCVTFAHRGFTPSSPVPGATAPDTLDSASAHMIAPVTVLGAGPKRAVEPSWRRMPALPLPE